LAEPGYLICDAEKFTAPASITLDESSQRANFFFVETDKIMKSEAQSVPAIFTATKVAFVTGKK